MYRSCIFCSADLGTNEVIETFPVGRRVAFDAWKGRLWVVCPKCTRWNLSPIEERWEAVESAEKLFRDSRLRVQSENIGLAKLPDGTRLIRVGEALPGELAAWRYGDQLLRRRRQYLFLSAAVGAGAIAVLGGIAALGVGGGIYGIFSAFSSGWEERQQKKVIHRLRPELSPTRDEVVIRRWHVQGAYLDQPEGAEGIALHIPDATRTKRKTDGWGRSRFSDDVLVLPDREARVVLGRSMVHLNKKGASRGNVQEALRLLADARSAEAYLHQVARRGGVLGKRSDMQQRQLAPVHALALEMALHEESERRALEGELGMLEAAWREAEEIAQIADSLLDDPLRRLRS